MKIDKPLARPTKKKEKRQKLLMDPRSITGEQSSIINNSVKFDNLNEINRFFQRHRLPKLTQEETDNLKSPTSLKVSLWF